MKRTSVLYCGIFVALLIMIGHGNMSSGAENPITNQFRIPAGEAANYIHTVIRTNRTVYTKHVVEWLQEKEVVAPAEQWEEQNALPLPAQMLLYSGLVAAETGSGVSYRLASLWPIYPKNGPATDFERKGLEAVAKDPDQPYTGMVKRGPHHVFQAVYSDRAVSNVCVSCHNGHERSPRRDYKLNDVMGGIILSFPVDESADKLWVNPETVADYIYSVIHADRAVYARLVVDRLQQKGVVFADEDWKRKKALPLPAQMLLYAGQLASEANDGVSYRLASLWPMYPKNGPATDFERKGLEAVAKDPDQPYTGMVKRGPHHVFQAVYSDRAVSNVCVSCHNGHELSPRRDYKLNDVMGGIILRFPINRE